MFPVQGPSKHACSLLAVLCGRVHNYKQKQEAVEDEGKYKYPFAELSFLGLLEVQTLINPGIDEFKEVLEASKPSIVYLQGQQFMNEEAIGPLVWRGVDLSSPEAVSGLFSRTLPITVYLEIPDSEKLAEAVNTRGVAYTGKFHSYFTISLIVSWSDYCKVPVVIHGMPFNLHTHPLGSTVYGTTM